MKIFKSGITISFILSLALSANSISDEKSASYICIGDKSIGFNWENKNWVETRFNTDKYLVKKISKEMLENDFAYSECHNLLKSKSEDRIDVEYGCYNIRTVGEHYYPFETEVCTEFWTPLDINKKLTQVNCKYFSFRPNGWFHKAFTHSSLEDKPYKDSLGVSVGKCAKL
ncbi:hypothetical protein [Endozoicomonas sp. ALE010]|uniref:hypothetical protein n=1 Tax=Endozoicomonas sp. ALE010 TaxID=3403081 RepID=UPI003BB72D08